MDRIQIKNLINQKFPNKYHEQGLTVVLDKIESFSSLLREEFEKYLTTGEEPSLEIAGYSFKILKEEHGMNAIAAFLTLDWLSREPEKAVASLKRGHDTVVTKTV